MPVTRRSSGGRSSQAAAKQSTLSFNHRVTKSVPKSAKKNISSTTPVKASPLSKQIFKEEDVEVEDEEPVTVIPVVEPEDDKSEAELRAAKVSDRQITSYWTKQERAREAQRVHQEDLTLSEKVLRYFDVSNQYGPCVGITRMKRWQRADSLGLNPPVEVLAVLMKEQEKGTKDVKMAHIDQILNSTAIDAN